jgi:hypothetical protein
MSLAGDQLQRMTAIDTAGIAPAAPIDQVVLTLASVEPLVSDLFSVTLTPAVPAYLARVGPTRRMALRFTQCVTDNGFEIGAGLSP